MREATLRGMSLRDVARQVWRALESEGTSKRVAPPTGLSALVWRSRQNE